VAAFERPLIRRSTMMRVQHREAGLALGRVVCARVGGRTPCPAYTGAVERCA
jgi:hypothetical protein